MAAQKHDAIEREIRIAAQPETIFAFFTDPEKAMRWMGVAAHVTVRLRLPLR